jgi:hypothetical protein
VNSNATQTKSNKNSLQLLDNCVTRDVNASQKNQLNKSVYILRQPNRLELKKKEINKAT